MTNVDRLRARLRAFFAIEMYGEAATAEDAERDLHNLPDYRHDLEVIIRALLNTFRDEGEPSDEGAAARVLARFDQSPEAEA